MAGLEISPGQPGYSSIAAAGRGQTSPLKLIPFRSRSKMHNRSVGLAFNMPREPDGPAGVPSSPPSGPP